MSQVISVKINSDSLEEAIRLYNSCSKPNYTLVSLLQEAKNTYHFICNIGTVEVKQDLIGDINKHDLTSVKVRLLSLIIKAHNEGYLKGKWCPKFNLTSGSLATPTLKSLNEDSEFQQISRLGRFLRSIHEKFTLEEIENIALKLGYQVLYNEDRYFYYYGTNSSSRFMSLHFIKAEEN